MCGYRWVPLEGGAARCLCQRALWSLRAGAAAGCCCLMRMPDVDGSVCFWRVRSGAAAGCGCRVPLLAVYGSVRFGAAADAPAVRDVCGRVCIVFHHLVIYCITYCSQQQDQWPVASRVSISGQKQLF